MSIVLVGSTSGSITLQEPAVAGSTVLTLPAVTGTVLTDTSPKVGNVIQVVNATYSTGTTNGTTTYADTGLTATITPTSSSSKILILVNQSGLNNSQANSGTTVQLLRSSTSLIVFASFYGFAFTGAVMGASACYLDSPATTSATTYKTQFRRGAGSGDAYVQDNSSTSTITLMEIAA